MANESNVKRIDRETYQRNHALEIEVLRAEQFAPLYSGAILSTLSYGTRIVLDRNEGTVFIVASMLGDKRNLRMEDNSRYAMNLPATTYVYVVKEKTTLLPQKK
jgi:hypothetical protein